MEGSDLKCHKKGVEGWRGVYEESDFVLKGDMIEDNDNE